jgi:hypothetical protein
VSVWKYERDIENIKIEISRIERMINEKQDDFQRATRKGEEADARQYRREQLKFEGKLRELIRELIQVEKKLQAEKDEEIEKLTWW